MHHSNSWLRRLVGVRLSWLLVTAVFGPAANTALAADAVQVPSPEQSGLTLSESWARATPPGATVGAAYFSLRNTGKVSLNITGFRSEAAGDVELHDTQVVDGVSRMRPVTLPITLAPGESLQLSEGGKHLMLMSLTGPLKAGAQVPVTVLLDQGAALSLLLPVQDQAADADPHAHMHH
jgi:copper(I)-binding protein